MLVTGFWESTFFFFFLVPLCCTLCRVCVMCTLLTACLLSRFERCSFTIHRERTLFLHIFLSVCIVCSTRSHIAVLAWHSIVYFHRDRMIYFLSALLFFCFFYSWSSFITEWLACGHWSPTCSVTAVFLKHRKKKKKGRENRLSNGVSLIVTHLVTKSMIVDAELPHENHKLGEKK